MKAELRCRKFEIIKKVVYATRTILKKQNQRHGLCMDVLKELIKRHRLCMECREEYLK